MKFFLQKTILIGLVLILGGCNLGNKSPSSKLESERRKDSSMKNKIIKESVYTQNCKHHILEKRSVYYWNKAQKVYNYDGNKKITADGKTFKCLGGEYFKDKNNVYHQKRLIKGADINTFKPLGKENLYAKDKNFVYHGSLKIENADSKTFKPIENYEYYAKDKNSVYFGRQQIENSDIETFTPISSEIGYAKDKNNAYFYGYSSKKNRVYGKIEESDAPTFLVSNYYAKDKNNAYYFGKKIPRVDIDSFEFINEKNNFVYAKDKKYVYFAGEKIEDSDPATFQLFDKKIKTEYPNLYIYGKDQFSWYFGKQTIGLNFKYLKQRYIKDDYHVYYEGKLVKEADPKTFQLIESPFFEDFNCYAKDKNNVYNQGKKLNQFFSDGFQILGYNYLKDKNNVFFDPRCYECMSTESCYDCGMKIVRYADPETFKSLGNMYAKDKNSVFYKGEKIKGVDPTSFKIPTR